MEGDLKEVYFNEYCNKCKHKSKKETDNICNDCLNSPVREYTHKPVYFEEK